MQSKKILIILLLVLFNSCIIKSIHPFYISEAITFEKSFIGVWSDTKNGKWEIISLKSEFEKDKEPKSQEDLKIYNQYKNGYFIKYTENNKEASFIGITFKINKELFIDFNLFDYNSEKLNSLAKLSVIETHTVAKVDIQKNGNVNLKWLDEDVITDLLEKEQLHLKHEKIGIQENLILTGSSDQLFKFLKKYSESDIKDKWKTSNECVLKKE